MSNVKSDGTVLIKPHKKLFLQAKEEEEILLEGEVALNPLFLSTHVASTDYDQIKQLKLPNKNIAKSENLGFVQFLQRLELPNNKLKNIHFLEDNKDITYVDVSQNKIESLDSLRHLAKLEIVKAAHNQIKAISVDSLTTSAATLKAIILNNNELRSIPRSYSPFKLVNTLVVSHNEIENLKGIEMYPNLKKLSASNNAIRSLPLEIKRLVGLAELRLAHNKIMTLPDSISDNVNLKMLILNDNMINSFDDIKRLATCENLRELDLTNNPIKKQENYKSRVLELLPKLRKLDGEDVGGAKPQKDKPEKKKKDTRAKKTDKKEERSEKKFDSKKEKSDGKKEFKSREEKPREKAPKKEKPAKEETKKRKREEPVEEEEQEQVPQDNDEMPEAIVEKLVEDKPNKAPKRIKVDGEVVNLVEEKAKKRIQKELGGGYSEHDDKHAGVVGSYKNRKHKKSKADVLSFLQTEESNAGSW